MTDLSRLICQSYITSLIETDSRTQMALILVATVINILFNITQLVKALVQQEGYKKIL